MKVLALGGSGYIGSHMVGYLQAQDIDIACVVINDLSFWAADHH